MDGSSEDLLGSSMDTSFLCPMPLIFLNMIAAFGCLCLSSLDLCAQISSCVSQPILRLVLGGFEDPLSAGYIIILLRRRRHPLLNTIYI